MHDARAHRHAEGSAGCASPIRSRGSWLHSARGGGTTQQAPCGRSCEHRWETGVPAQECGHQPRVGHAVRRDRAAPGAPASTRASPVRRLNSNHLDTADFEQEPTLKAVLVGGNKLSRGVTIEGLLVSYYVRLAPYYDTLLQMGRWFGYRGDYVDLTRLYSTELLISWFHDLATAEEDLRRQIELYDKKKATPLQFAPKIRSHPAMLVTAENKMRGATEIDAVLRRRAGADPPLPLRRFRLPGTAQRESRIHPQPS